MTLKVNSWTEFQPLKTVMVGDVYDQSFFDGIKNDTIREGLKEIVGGTKEDIQYFKKVVKEKGIEVIQLTTDDLNYKKNINDYINEEGMIGKDTQLSRDGFRNGIPVPPLAIRDDVIVMGNNLLVTDPNPYATSQAMTHYKEMFGDQVDNTIADNNIEFKRSVRNIRSWANRNNLSIEDADIKRLQSEKPLNGFCAPNLTRIGKKILVDVWQAPYLIEEFMEKKYPKHDYQRLFIGGHNDSVFSVLKPGVVIAASWLEPYADIFKGWDIIWFDEPDWARIAGHQMDMKRDNSGCYWYPDKQDNPQLESFIDEWLSTWHGHSSETIFDVNVLMLDENTCVVNSDSPKLLSELEKRKIEPVVIPLRNRFFWDGGWHCNTLDIYREGGCIDYGI
jgi:hypothetical protein